MDDLPQFLERCVARRVAWLGLGNVEFGDDGAGLELATQLACWVPSSHVVFVAGTTPERFLPRLRQERFSTVILLDAVEFGATAGAIAGFESDAFEARFPAVSTHKLPLSLLARLITSDTGATVSLIGIQPGSLRPGRGLSLEVAEAVDALTTLIRSQAQAAERVAHGQSGSFGSDTGAGAEWEEAVCH